MEKGGEDEGLFQKVIKMLELVGGPPVPGSCPRCVCSSRQCRVVVSSTFPREEVVAARFVCSKELEAERGTGWGHRSPCLLPGASRPTRTPVRWPHLCL